MRRDESDVDLHEEDRDDEVDREHEGGEPRQQPDDEQDATYKLNEGHYVSHEHRQRDAQIRERLAAEIRWPSLKLLPTVDDHDYPGHYSQDERGETCTLSSRLTPEHSHYSTAPFCFFCT